MKNYKDVYQMPLELDLDSGWVYDQKRNFVFQFQIHDEEKQNLLIEVINGKQKLKNKELKFKHVDGKIKRNNNDDSVILIRGWGNLTGIGTMNLSDEDASNIQDTFAEFVVKQLNKR